MSASPYLLDTHAIVWAVENPSLLSRGASAAIQRGERILSVASFWEVVIKARKNQFDIPDPVAWWYRVVADLDATVLLIRQTHDFRRPDSYHHRRTHPAVRCQDAMVSYS